MINRLKPFGKLLHEPIDIFFRERFKFPLENYDKKNEHTLVLHSFHTPTRQFSCHPRRLWQNGKAYIAPPYVTPPPIPSRLNLVDNGDGTITETKSKLMWTKKDSFADLGKCLNWQESIGLCGKPDNRRA